MRPKKHETTGSGDLFRARLDQIINMRHELVQLAGKIDWEFIDGEIAPLYSDGGRPGIATQFVIGLFLLKHIYGLSDEGVCERWVYDPYFQHFTGEEFFQHEFPPCGGRHDAGARDLDRPGLTGRNDVAVCANANCAGSRSIGVRLPGLCAPRKDARTVPLASIRTTSPRAPTTT
jgi:Transposase domain (DUF772)